MNSYLKKKIITFTAPVFTGLGAHRLFQSRYAGAGHILMFHRVVPAEQRLRIHNHLSLEITPEHFERTILFFKKRNYAFYALDDIHKALVEGDLSRKFVAFTFDDGYLDNLTVAYPILKKHQVPFTVYVATNMPDRRIILWWYILEDMVREKDRIEFHWNGRDYRFECRTPYEKERAFDAIHAIIQQSFSLSNYREMFHAIMGTFQPDLHVYADRMSMNWTQIRDLSRDPLATIGAHTVSHYPLTQLDAPALQTEIEQSRILIERHIEQPVKHFAYPFGKAAQASYREFEMVKSLGFKTATTTRVSNVFPAHVNHLECLPRINVNRVSNDRVLQMQTAGMLPAIIHRGKQIVTH